jgi:glycerophosphoryl diester phosphodiesterase
MDARGRYRLGPVHRGARRRGLQVHDWTVNDRAEMTRLLSPGEGGLMTDRHW